MVTGTLMKTVLRMFKRHIARFLSLALTFLLYYAIGFGNIADISRFMWLFPPVIIMIFTGLVCLFLYRKIVTVDMNDSLKAVE